MEGGGIVQGNQLAEVGEADAVAVPCHFLEDRKGASERLHADALTIVGIVVDVGLRRLHQFRDRGLAQAGRLFDRLRLGSRSQGKLHITALDRNRRSDRLNSAMPRDRDHTTISIDVQYYEK